MLFSGLPITEWFWGKYYSLIEWWRYHHYHKPLYAAGHKLINLNPDVMPDTISIHTWTRLWLIPLVCEIRFMRLDEEVTVGSGLVNKNGDMALIFSGKSCWVWLYRNRERYVIAPQGIPKER